jgi:hypothetical protein
MQTYLMGLKKKNRKKQILSLSLTLEQPNQVTEWDRQR